MTTLKTPRCAWILVLVTLLALAPIAQAADGPGFFRGSGPHALWQTWMNWWNSGPLALVADGRAAFDPSGFAPAPEVEDGRPGLDPSGVAVTDESESEDDRSAHIDPLG